MTSIVEVQNVSKFFGSLRAVDGVSVNIEEKSLTILIGPNGSGKTTLINTIAGLYRADTGKVIFAGRDITKLPSHKIYRLGMARTFQIPTLFWKLSVLENVVVAAKNNPGEGFARSMIKRSWIKAEKQMTEDAFKTLEVVGLYDVWEHPAESLSGGQMKLLELGRSMAGGAKVILLDEPISGVNPRLAHEIFEKLVSLRADLGITFFIIEHRLDIALRYIDTVVAMAFGKVLAAGKPEIVMADPRLIEAYLGA
ncbi:MAG TPA: ABC transporter ATP-binding protein [Nitrososphaerales archaeon]|jgi:branched-chain amino acid transport system ATP-binding protein|nr:ABC transporter ATP-binding protein [Nitrososphaerales archaeon]